MNIEEKSLNGYIKKNVNFLLLIKKESSKKRVAGKVTNQDKNFKKGLVFSGDEGTDCLTRV